MVITLRTMVRAWIVALLVLFTDQLLFGISQPVVTVATESTLATTDEDVDTTVVPVSNLSETSSIGCKFKGRSHESGSLVNTDQPCLKCTCVTGNLVCHLQICPELPDPPPKGCVIVHKKNKCCAHLQCFYEQYGAVQSKLFSLQTESRSGPARMENSAIVTLDGQPIGCVINGTIYAEGSAMDSSSLCEYCYCIKGHQQCIQPQCSLTIANCTAVYKKHTCCPVRYKCLPLENTQIQNTTNTSTTGISSSLSSRLKDCRINGRLISLGEPVIGIARSSCETCFCINGQVRCDKVICPPIRTQILPNCRPVYSEGHCCPTSYNCTSNNESHVNLTTTTSTLTTVTSPSTMNIDDILLSSSPPPLVPPSSPPPTMSAVLVENESTTPENVDSKNVTDSTMELVEDPIESRHANSAENLMQDDFGKLNVTEKSNNFEMDYDQPTLPPSLPNLKIIPFVAADAVVDEPGAVYNNYQPVVERVYNVSDVEGHASLVANNFSPPIETEGGFIPKDSPNSAVYVSDKLQVTTEHMTILPTVYFDENIEEHRPTGSDWCLSNGKKYKHGELLTDPSACSICVCFNAKVVCQENCPAVKIGCQRINDSKNSTCCGRIICNESENDITTGHNIKLIETTSEAYITTTNRRDTVIEHIIYSAPSTIKSVVISSPTTIKYTMSSEPTTSRPKTSTAQLDVTSAPTTEKSAVSLTFVPNKPIETTTQVPKVFTTLAPKPLTTSTHKPLTTSTPKPHVQSTSKPLEDEDYSFESMFSFLFNGDSTEQSSSTSTNNVVAETRIEHRTDEDVDENVQLVDEKPQTNSMLFAELFKTDLNPYVEQSINSKNHSNTKPDIDLKQHSENKHNKNEFMNVNNPIEVKTNSETKPNISVKLDSEIKHHVNVKPHSDIKQPGDIKSHSVIKQHVDIKPHPEIKQNGILPSKEIKSHIETNLYSDVKQQAEVKTHFDAKENIQETFEHDKKRDGVVNQNHNFSKQQSEIKSHLGVKEYPDIKLHTNSTLQSDFKHQTELKTHFDHKEPVEGRPQFDFKHQTQVKTHTEFKPHIDVSSQSEVKHYTEMKSNLGTKPLKTKTDAGLNFMASILKVSGCNIYGRMYRVGKIISELSNPCLECMCTEIGVHCNQLKC